jgi:two-component system chemotaxis response regulator CheY
MERRLMAKLILIVDDSATMVMSIKTTLHIAGYEVITASDGVEAFSYIKNKVKPDLIITDINMPNMGGIELIKNVRTILRFVPILTLTTESEVKIREEGKKSGATGWLVKPVSGVDLVKIIKQIVP